jgi:hypothetical protein
MADIENPVPPVDPTPETQPAAAPASVETIEDEFDEFDDEDEDDEEWVEERIEMAVEVATGLCKAALKGQRVQLHGATPEEVGEELAAMYRATLEGILEVFLPDDSDDDDECIED